MKVPPQTQTSSPLYVSRPDLPNLEDTYKYLEQIKSARYLTNNGPVLQTFEAALRDYLSAPHISVFSNGTLALQSALAGFNLSGTVITTPYSFVATAHILKPLGLTPRFVDIDPETLCIDPQHIEAAIDKDVCAILGVHVYGTPCDVEAIEAIAHEHKLKVIYDAAHAFGIEYKGQPLLSYGDASVLSFHATKSFHSVEGGAIITPHSQLDEWVRVYRNFGLDSHGSALFEGINGKMSELHAAIGMLNLERFEVQRDMRKHVVETYKRELADIPGIQLIAPNSDATQNYGYMPIRITADYGLDREALVHAFEEHNIYPRRYFYPLITDMPAYAEHKQLFPIASKVADEILCLPLFHDMDVQEQDSVIAVLKHHAQ
ncbi:MAG: aminotransferase [Micavibrio sp.]|nr:aminotransferase [Micavibrio sp.]|tara:strand:- start:291 stop:1415 length:1125 start_codon:yes stop_codon:yes gene_type:complete